MALPQKDNWIEEINPASRRRYAVARRTARLRAGATPWQDAHLEYAVMHGDEAEAARLREKLKRLTDMI